MRKRAVAGSILGTTAILLLGWELGTTVHPGTGVSASAAHAATPSQPAAPGSAPAAGPVPAAMPSPSAASPAAPAAPAAPSGSFTGSMVSTEYGNVQVQITVAAGTITDVTALHLTDSDGRSVQISNRAAPVLRTEVLSAQSSSVQMVSGATYTSEGYLTSLQSALDKAGIK
ncbi:FMN-binding protein [Glaciibacter psychrotolerans]|uniref:Uncharacterized protein with FMN-binding domain n=1 Tax=Glaciibacter psychrotolerans TaxID=670054 RepID=A0A7Z0J6J6_9MICO|nr:uncharacterized protein with FMN-binding domain [Leifsonia psychrotolerans]